MYGCIATETLQSHAHGNDLFDHTAPCISMLVSRGKTRCVYIHIHQKYIQVWGYDNRIPCISMLVRRGRTRISTSKKMVRTSGRCCSWACRAVHIAWLGWLVGYVCMCVCVCVCVCVYGVCVCQSGPHCLVGRACVRGVCVYVL
jgi:hypothetical protein